MTKYIMNKKNKLTTVLIIVIAIALVVIIIWKNTSRPKEVAPISQQETELNNAVTSDTTASINTNIDGINVDDTTTADLQTVDQEIQKL